MIDIEYTHPDGFKERIRESSRTKKGAEKRHREIVNALEAGTWRRREDGNDRKPMTLTEFAEEFIETYAKVNNKPSEVASKESILKRYLKPALGKRRMDQLKLRDIERLKAKLLAKSLSPKTVNNALAVLSKMLRYAKDLDLIDDPPRVRLLKAPKPGFDFLDFEEADQLLDGASYNREWYAMIFFTLRTGVRYGELCELRWADVNLKAGRLMVRRSYYRGNVTTPKGGREREIPLSPKTLEFLKRHRHLKGELIFCKPDGGRRIARRADVAIKRCCRKAGLREISWHVLRHTFASHLVMNGVPIKTVQELLGHATIEMTMRYAHLSPAVKCDAVATLDRHEENERHHSGTKAKNGG